ncbi:hypothetical protein M4S82_11020 [Planococcus sp. MERTA32b]|nr:hypothetical protein [Planococcus sp. MER TA 32b]
MNYFLKLNAVSILYALMAAIPLEMMLNVYRITRLTGWKIGTVNILTAIILFAILIAGTLLLFRLTENWLGIRKPNYFTALLWFPYFILFVYTFTVAFPFTYGGDDPNPVTGLLMIFGIVSYPFYILFLNNLAMMADVKGQENVNEL